MGLTIVLETENGEALVTVLDPKNLLHQLLPSHDDHTFFALRNIDWYGDTVFNRLQMEEFLSEWNRLRTATLSQEETEILDEIGCLGLKCQKETHLYLKFYGD